MAVREFKRRTGDLTLLLRLKGTDKAYVEQQAKAQGCSGTEVVRRLLKAAVSTPTQKGEA